MASASLPHKTILFLSSKASREVHVWKEHGIASLLEEKDVLDLESLGKDLRTVPVFMKWLCARSLSPKENHLRSN